MTIGIDGKNIKNVDFYKILKNGQEETYACVYFSDMTAPIRVPQKKAIKYLEAAAKANGMKPNRSQTLEKLAKKNIFSISPAPLAKAKFAESMTDYMEAEKEIETKTKKKLNKKGVKIGALAIALAVLAGVAVKCGLQKKSTKYGNNNQQNVQYQQGTFAALLAKLHSGVKKDAVSLVQTNLQNFNDTLSGSIMKPGENKRLAHSWEENMASYLAFNQFTSEELYQIFDTYPINANELYDQLKLGNMKEMLYYARATEPSGRGNLINSDEGKKFFNRYESLILAYNKATEKEEKIRIAKEFYANVRIDFPVNDQNREGFIHTDKGYEDYAYAVIPMISAMEVMTRNVDVNLTEKEVTYLNELGMCNFAQEKLETYQNELVSRQAVAIAKEELSKELEATVSSEGTISFVEEVRYQDLKEAGIAAIEHYDLSSEMNDVGTIPGYWEDATLDSSKHNIETNNSSSYSSTNGSYKKPLTEADLKKESSMIQKEAAKQKDKINSQIEKENAAAKAESDKKKEELENQIEKEKEQLEEEIKNDNAWMNDDKNNSSSNEEVAGRPSRDDVDDHIDIDDNYVDDDGNLEFDGPIYDKDGNIIDRPNPGGRSIPEEIEVLSTEESQPIMTMEFLEETPSFDQTKIPILEQVEDPVINVSPMDDRIVITDPKPPVVPFDTKETMQTEINRYVDQLASTNYEPNETLNSVIKK